MGGKSLIDEQRLAPTHGMGAYDGMRRIRKDLAAIVAAHEHIGRVIDVFARMRSRESFEIGLHARRQRVVCGILAREQRISTDRRHGVEVQNAAQRRLLVAGDVGMPIFPSDALGIGVSMDGQNLGMSLRTRRVRVNVQVSKIAAERLVRFHVERLIAKEQNLMLRQRLVQLLELAVAERLGERQAVDLGANARRDRRDVDGFVAHGVTLSSAGKIYEFSGTAATAGEITAAAIVWVKAVRRSL